MKFLRQKRSGYRSGNNRQKCGQLKYAISPGKQFRREQFRQETVFRRPKQRGLRARQKNDPVREIRVALVERENRKQHRRNFKQLRPDRSEEHTSELQSRL